MPMLIENLDDLVQKTARRIKEIDVESANEVVGKMLIRTAGGSTSETPLNMIAYEDQK